MDETLCYFVVCGVKFIQGDFDSAAVAIRIPFGFLCWKRRKRSCLAPTLRSTVGRRAKLCSISREKVFVFCLNSCKHMCFLKGAETIEIDRAQFQPLIDSGEVEKTLKKWKKTRFLMGASIVREGSQPDKMEGILTFLSRSRI